jgi:hypothetical protein
MNGKKNSSWMEECFDEERSDWPYDMWANQKISVNEISVTRGKISANINTLYSDGIRKFVDGRTKSIEM